MLEKTIENKVVKYALENKVLAYKFNSLSTRGVPDRMFISPSGVVFFIEFKSSTGKLSALQKKTIDRMLKNNATVYVCNNVKDGIEIIQKYS